MTKKLTNGPIACSLTFSDQFQWYSKVPCFYDDETIRYAVSRFFARCGRICRDCTTTSYQLRLKNKHKKHWFVYVIPAPLMELPGNWVRICGSIDAEGVTVAHAAIFNQYPEIKG